NFSQGDFMRYQETKRRNIWIGIIAIGILVAAFVGWQWYLSRDRELSEKPPRSASAADFPTRPSVIGASLEIPFAALASAANAAAEQFAKPQSGRVHIDCRHVEFFGITLFDGCLDFDWHFDAHRNGSISVARAGDDGIGVSVPVTFTGGGGFAGDIAGLLSLG